MAGAMRRTALVKASPKADEQLQPSQAEIPSTGAETG
jgi:hypothetical protein